jgi:hypothetical protein
MLCNSWVFTRCICNFISVVGAWVNQHVVAIVFMGLLPLSFMLYVWGVFRIVFSRKSSFAVMGLSMGVGYVTLWYQSSRFNTKLIWAISHHELSRFVVANLVA